LYLSADIRQCTLFEKLVCILLMLKKFFLQGFSKKLRHFASGLIIFCLEFLHLEFLAGQSTCCWAIFAQTKFNTAVVIEFVFFTWKLIASSEWGYRSCLIWSFHAANFENENYENWFYRANINLNLIYLQLPCFRPSRSHSTVVLEQYNECSIWKISWVSWIQNIIPLICRTTREPALQRVCSIQLL